MELALAIGEVLAEMLLELHELAKIVENGVGRRRGVRPSQCPEAGNGEGVGSIGLRPTQVFLREPAGHAM